MFDMDGYEIYILPSYAAAFGVLAAVALWSLRRNARIRNELRRLEERAKK